MSSIHDRVVARAELLRNIREFFDTRGFYEVQPPCLASDCVVDAYIDPIVIEAERIGLAKSQGRERFYLQSSPELIMKRMLVDGAPSIYSIGPVYRAGEVGTLHNPEFIMLEWYHLAADVEQEIELLCDFACQMLGYDRCDVVTYSDAFQEHLGMDPLKEPLEGLCERVSKVDAALAASLATDRDALLDVLISEYVQPELGKQRPVVLRDYPATQAALAKVLDKDPRYAARFELYLHGVELANGYEELVDAEELLARGHANNQRRVASGREPLRADTSLVEAMRRGLPDCSGVALGVDRLLMLKMGSPSLAAVLPMTIEQV